MEEEKLPNITKDEMLQYINSKVKEHNISDNIIGYFLFVRDDKGSVNIGQCSQYELLKFLAKGVISLARTTDGNVLQTAIDVLHVACELNNAEQQKKEQEQEGV